MIYTRRRRSQSFGSFGSFRDQQIGAENNKPELIEGYAHICFPDEKARWFRGILLTADGTSYTLSGNRKRLGVTEEEMKQHMEEQNQHSPDVLHDYPSPLGGGSSRGSASVGPTSRQNSLDARTAGELQFILEEIPACTSTEEKKEPVSVIGSPPTTQQIIRALDNLLIRNSSSGGCLLSDERDGGSPATASPAFRSRSGSKTGQPLETVSVLFDISVSDLEDGTSHDIRGVAGRKGNNFTLRNRQLCFVTDRSFWGQRADMVIQKQLAAPDLVGQGCHVFAGPMRFYFDNEFSRIAPSSSLTNWCW